jgi:hypothetical protein
MPWRGCGGEDTAGSKQQLRADLYVERPTQLARRTGFNASECATVGDQLFSKYSRPVRRRGNSCPTHCPAAADPNPDRARRGAWPASGYDARQVETARSTAQASCVTSHQLLQGKNVSRAYPGIIANIYSEAYASPPSCYVEAHLYCPQNSLSYIRIKLNKETGHRRGYPQTPPTPRHVRYATTTQVYTTTRACYK